MGDVLVLSHRGRVGPEAQEAPDNTLEAFLAASRAGAAGFETDVQKTRDGHAVLYHDALTADGRFVAELDHAELSETEGYYVPLLTEALLAFPDHVWNLQLKRGDAVAPVIKVLRDLPDVSRFVITSYEEPAAREVGIEVGCPYGYLMPEHRHLPPDRLISRVSRAADEGASALVWDLETLPDAAGEQCRNHNMACWAYDLRGFHGAREALARGAEVLIADDLAAARAATNE